MFDEEIHSYASQTVTFLAEEDDVIDALLSILRLDKWENFQMHYETGTLSAERTDLHVHSEDDGALEVPVTFAMQASWTDVEDGQFDLMIGVEEPEYDWTQDHCETAMRSIFTALKSTFPSGPSGGADKNGAG